MSDGLSSKASSSDDEVETISNTSKDEENCNAIVLQDNQQDIPSFGNVSVMNSTDIHFGNKTVYQGPVTIKQFLYANGHVQPSESVGVVLNDSNIELKDKNGFDNPSFENDLCKAESRPNNNVGQDTNQTEIGRHQWLHLISQPRIMVGLTFLALSVIILSVTMITVLLLNSQENGSSNNSASTNNDAQDELDNEDPFKNSNGSDASTNWQLNGKIRIVTRSQWLAQPPIHEANNLSIPAPFVIISHTASENCAPQSKCVGVVLRIQNLHIETNGWWDIGYNFLVGGDGNAYEGRGWTKEGAHVYGYNNKSIGIAFIGNFRSQKPPSHQIYACKQLIQKGVNLGYISKEYKLYAARQLQATESPGKALYEDMKSWSHWDNKPDFSSAIN